MNINKLILLLILLMLIGACSEKQKISEDNLDAKQSGITTESSATKLKSEKVTASKIVKYDPTIISFNGFGTAKFGGNGESVRMSWGAPLLATKPAEGASCITLNMDPIPANNRVISFMFEHGKFVRYDIYNSRFVAPGDLVVGDDANTILAQHSSQVEIQPHKYIEGGRTFTVSPTKGKTRLIFEVDASNKIISWRIGLPPQVYYVEGCG